MAASETIELHAAWRWDCPECGLECWIRGLHLESEHLTEAQRAVLREEEWWVLYPELVRCDHCKSGYIVEMGEITEENDDA
jgi:hypothetical protein|tara:strand:+ start:1783 stop:2025 length:243 start_codon:yes stop_codon:yes gene_type:complete